MDKNLKLIINKQIDIRLFLYLKYSVFDDQQRYIKYNEKQSEANYITMKEQKALDKLFDFSVEDKKMILNKYYRSRLEDWLIETRWETIERLSKKTKPQLINEYVNDLWDCHCEEVTNGYE